FLCVVFCLITISNIRAQSWDKPIRGSWMSTRNTEAGFVLVGNNKLAEIVVSSKEGSNVMKTANVLASDIKKITGQQLPVVEKPTKDINSIRLFTPLQTCKTKI
ncbi:MAG: hypothetical protein KAS71_10035, partial [Bacteroidales bacterium]|nr:hypothetical protein [Bacteroidales bacterium]